MPLDDAATLPDIAPDAPCGPNLEFDPEFAEFERLVQGRPEQQYGATIVPAEEPDWKEVVARGRALLGRTHDLRVMAQLAVARLQREGVEGFAEALGLVREAVETRWAQVHPLLDPEDDDDPTLRSNALLLVGEPGRVLRVLRVLPLARSARAG
ncbi:MAG: ImpA family type VI secretion system protein [Janthinobacterium lividum]